MATYELAQPSRTAPHARTGALTYFLLAFAISWILVIAVVGLDGFPGTPVDFAVLLPVVVVAMLAGPSVAGLLSNRAFQGKTGLQGLKHRLLHWRVGARWYLIALLAAPFTAFTVLTLLSIASPVYEPGIFTVSNPGRHLLLGVLTGIAAGLFEEIGWTGFAVPRLRLRHGIFATGLIVGIVWGAWHLLAVWWGSAPTRGSVPIALYLPAMTLSFLPPYRILMVWVSDRTQSLLVAMLMHASLTASLRILDPVPILGAPIVLYNLLLAAALWIAVAVLAVTLSGQRQQLSGRRSDG